MTDDRVWHFYSIVGDLCDQARLGELEVLVETRDGDSIAGVPLPRPAPPNHPQALDDTGYADDLHIGDRRIALRDVSTIHFRCP